jgi:hypothetical protein
MRYTSVFETKNHDNGWDIQIVKTPYINDVSWFLIFALIFYGGGLLGGFEYFLGELDFTQKSNRRIFLLLVLAWYIPIFIAKMIRVFAKQRQTVHWIRSENLWTVDGHPVPQAQVEWGEGEDPIHGNDLWQIWLYSTKAPDQKVLIYQSPQENQAKKLFEQWSSSMTNIA